MKLNRSLYDAVKRGQVQQAQRYLEQGADPNAPVGKGGASLGAHRQPAQSMRMKGVENG